jgi:hypothetical protein
MEAPEFLATLFGGMVLGGIVSASVIFLGMGEIVSNVQITNLDVEINETKVITTMMDEMEKRGYFEKVPSWNNSNWTLWYNSSYGNYTPDCCYPAECTGLFDAPIENCTWSIQKKSLSTH